ncbi:CBFD-NFYB-HMF domain-containing protein [Mycena chlorophos]|uniref:CBFD-NFYB-HMF domain-containing protein n=1 Tax=Mycena chlorophos TaxID=658473 RepID=A0A8H6SB95_MYCCL|nr:CBFD-NFYB-HMF domain-containing protein [Mycena chlorophos]
MSHQASTPAQPFVQPGEPLNDFLRAFWQRQIDAAEAEGAPDYRHPPLPLARIKKVMKSDPDVKMIAADAPILFCKACEIFIAEITARAFIVADSNKRRTLSRADIAKALTKSDQFDFLIDIVPREDPLEGREAAGGSGSGGWRGWERATRLGGCGWSVWIWLRAGTCWAGTGSPSAQHGASPARCGLPFPGPSLWAPRR